MLGAVAVVILISCPRYLQYIKPFRHMISVDGRLDFSSKKDFMNERCYSKVIINFPCIFIGAPGRYFLVRAFTCDFLWKYVLLLVVHFWCWAFEFSLLWIRLAHAFWFPFHFRFNFCSHIFTFIIYYIDSCLWVICKFKDHLRKLSEVVFPIWKKNVFIF